MKNSKIMITIITIVILAISGLSYSQDDTQKDVKKQYKCTPTEKATKITDRLNKRLNLTSEQYNKIQKLYTDNISYRREIRSKDLISKSEIKQKREEFLNGIKSILTDEQQKKMKMIMKKKNRRHHHRRHF